MRNYSIDAIRKLVAQRRMYCTFGSRGQLISANFLPHSSESILRTAHMGQRYSYPERVGDTHKAWRHAPMFAIRSEAGDRLEQHEIDLHIRAVFRAVPLSVMRREPEPPPSSGKVVSIASARRRPRLELVSDKRAA